MGQIRKFRVFVMSQREIMLFNLSFVSLGRLAGEADEEEDGHVTLMLLQLLTFYWKTTFAALRNTQITPVEQIKGR